MRVFTFVPMDEDVAVLSIKAVLSSLCLRALSFICSNFSSQIFLCFSSRALTFETKHEINYDSKNKIYEVEYHIYVWKKKMKNLSIITYLLFSSIWRSR